MKGRGFAHRQTKAAAGLAACLLLAGCTSTTSGIAGASDRGTPTSTTTPVGEPGQDVFLTQRPGTGTPFRLGATAAYDACTVLPLSAIHDIGIELDTHYQAVQMFMERDAPGDPSQARASNLNGLSNCQWFGTHNQLIVLDIYQPPFSDDQSRQIGLDVLPRKGIKEKSVRGLRTFTEQGVLNDPHEWRVSMFADSYWAALALKLTQASYPAGSHQDVVAKLVDGITANLLTGPTAPATFAYTGPYQGVPDPCALFTRQDFRNTYGVDDTGRVERWLTGGDRGQENDAHELARYIAIKCSRKAISPNGFDEQNAPGLEVELYVTPDTAQAALIGDVLCDPKSSAGKVFGPPKAIDTKIGDGRVCMPNEGRPPNRPLVFRAGRAVVKLYNWISADATDLDALAAKLTPAARAIAARVH